MQLCAPPCLPGIELPPNSFVLDDNGQPEQNPEASDQNGDNSDKAVTVEPAKGDIEITPINEDQVDGTKARLDLCNPVGCIELGASPEIGHLYIDNRGVRWRYVAEGVWLSANGEIVDDALLIPGYRENCLPEDDPSDDPCPPEFEGSIYVDSNGIQWIWVGFNSDPAESDHGRRWYSSASGSPEYRATIELEPWFDDCPPPSDPNIVPLASSIDVDVRVQGPVCVGDTVQVVMFATPSEGERITEYKITVNGNGDGTEQENATTFTETFVPEQVGEYEILGQAADSSGKSGQDTEFVKAIDCAEPQDQGQPSEPGATTTTVATPAQTSTNAPKSNTPPTIKLSTKQPCVEAASEAPTKVSVSISVSDADNDALSVTVKGASPSRTIGSKTAEVQGSGASTFDFTVDYKDRGTTITIDGQVDDGQAKANASISIRVVNPGGCSQSSTASQTTTTVKPAQTTTTTVKPAQTTTTTVKPAQTTTTLKPTQTTTTTTAPKSSTTLAPNSPGRLDLTTKCVTLGAQGTGTVAFTVVDPDGLKGVAVSPTKFVLKGDLATGRFEAGPIGKADAGASLTINVVDAKGVSGSYKLIVPAICG
jgi:hypothetical protein